MTTDNSDTNHCNKYLADIAKNAQHSVAGKVGAIPSLRRKNIVVQAIVVLLFAPIGVLTGWSIWGPFGASGSVIGALVLETFLSGF